MGRAVRARPEWSPACESSRAGRGVGVRKVRLEHALITSGHSSSLPAAQVAVAVRGVRRTRRGRDVPVRYGKAARAHVRSGGAGGGQAGRHAGVRRTEAGSQPRRVIGEALE